MKALIIGVAGFVGGHLTNELIGAGWDVSGTRLPLETTTLDIPVYELDILDSDAISDLLVRTNPDCIFHLAAQSSVAVSWKQPALTVDVNIKGAVNLLEAVRKMKAPPRVLLIGSGDEYGYILSDALPICEDAALRPGNIYACTKIAQGMLGQIYAKAYGLEIIIVRAFNHIGPGQTDTFVVASFCKQVAAIEADGEAGVISVGNLEAKRDFTDVRDIVRAYRLLADKGESGELYNVGSGKAISIAEILDLIIKQSAANINIEQDPLRMRPSDTPVVQADISKLVSCTGWNPTIPVEITIKDVLNEWRRKYCNLSFGTGGVRGIIGQGINCINHNTIQRVTQGLAKTILATDAPKSAGIAFDTRHNSAEFAQLVCDILSAYGIEVYTFDKPMPTPALSHAIRLMNLGWGVVITASHNPQEYNGYKVYNCHGVQVTDAIANKITEAIDVVDFFEPLPQKRQDLINVFDAEIERKYIEQIIKFVSDDEPDNLCAGDRLRSPAAEKCHNLSVSEECHSLLATAERPSSPIVYSALHGTGANVIPQVLGKLGFSPICIQQNPDGAFGGLKTPNPEEPIVYEKALVEAEKYDAKLILATDPDCDRVGVMVKTENGFKLLNGNQIGALLIDYLVQTRGVKKGDTVISTIVSGLLGELVAKDYGLEFVRLLTGFKYIGEYIVNLPKDKQFFFGYEESYGYLAGDGARDKDAVVASALIVKMVDFYDEKGMTLVERLQELSEKYGYCLESLHSVNITQNEQKLLMARLRSGILSKHNVIMAVDNMTRANDYMTGIGDLPRSDVIKLYFESDCNDSNFGAWAAIRPSGTEPKLKLYTGVYARTQKAAEESLESLTNKMSELLNDIVGATVPGRP